MTHDRPPMGPEYGWQQPATGKGTISEHSDIGVSRGFSRRLRENEHESRIQLISEQSTVPRRDHARRHGIGSPAAI